METFVPLKRLVLLKCTAQYQLRILFLVVYAAGQWGESDSSQFQKACFLSHRDRRWKIAYCKSEAEKGQDYSQKKDVIEN